MDVLRRTVWNHRDRLLQGLLVTVEVCAIAMAVALVVGLGICLVRLYVRPLRWVAVGYTEFARNTPIYVQLLWVSYVWPELFGWPRSFFDAGWAALALQSSGYLAETFRAGIEGVARGHREAAYSLGMSPALTLRRIVLPQAVRRMLPEAMNQFISLFKATTLVSLISVADLMYQVSIITQEQMRPLPLYSGTAFLYFAVIFAMSSAVRAFTETWRRRGWA
jgi:polar amino acid transport system permease protein